MAQQLDDWLRCCTVKITIPEQGGWGTGFFVAPGLILTCAHVVPAASANSVTIFHPEQQQSYPAIVESLPEANVQVDLVLLRLQESIPAHPCVYLDEAIALNDPLSSYGYPDDFPDGAFTTFKSEALTGGNAFIKFKAGQVRPGMSGSPLLNQSTGKVCGIVKFTRDRSIDLGGGAIPALVILEQFPQLRAFQQQFHQSDRRWSDLVAKLSEPKAMTQTNLGNKNYQIQTGAHNTNYIGETHIYNYSSPSPDAGSSARIIDFQPYLQAILDNEDYREWQDLYIPTTVEDRKRSRSVSITQLSQRGFSHRLKLRVEIVKSPKQQEKGRTEEPEQWEQVEQLDVLAGLRKYATEHEHVLLIGKPGSGKSTSLERLLWEESGNALNAPDAKIPVLVKLRRCTSTIKELIQDFFSRHQLALDVADIQQLLWQGKLLLLLDGLNELPELFRTEIANFRDRYRSTTPMIVSTRDLSGGGNLGITKTLRMLPLTEPQIQEFVQGYLGEGGNRLFLQLKNDRMRKFAETPLLLWMLCRVFALNGQVPANLGLAFREFTQLYDWFIQEDAPADSREQWTKLLRRLAFSFMYDKEPTDFRLSIPKEEAEDRLTNYLQQEGRANARECAERWLQDLLKYHLIQPVIQPNFEEHIEFRHQLIQEYYAAEYLWRIVPNLSDEQLKQDYLNYLKWTEPIALMLALIEEEALALRVVKLAMDDVDLILGARLAGEVRPPYQSAIVGRIDALEIPQHFKFQCWAISRSEEAIPRLLTALKHPDSLVRRKAVEGLGSLGSKAAIPGLLTTLKYSKDPEILRSAAATLRNLGSAMIIPDLLNEFENSGDFEEFDAQWRAANALENLGSEAAIPGLLTALKYSDYEVRCSAAGVLGRIGSAKVIPELLTVLKDPNSDFDLCLSIARALGEIGSKTAIPELIKSLQASTPSSRLMIAVALANLGSKAAIPELLKVFKDSDDEEIRWIAAEALGNLGNEAAIPVLLKALKDSNYEVRCGAAEALGKIGSAKVISNLLKAFGDTNYEVRASVAKALGNLGNEAAIPVLLKALKDSNYEVRCGAAEALGKIGNAKVISNLLKAFGDTNYEVRASVAKALGNLGNEAAIPVLLKALKDSNYEVRCSAVESLGKIGSFKHLAELWRQQLTSSNTDIYLAIAAIQNRCKYYNHEIAQG